MTRLVAILAVALSAAAADAPKSLRKSLLLYAPFDGSGNARYARGDSRIYSAPDYKSLEKAEVGMARADVEILHGQGVHGDALRFRSINKAALFLKASGGNTAYSPSGWSGSVSFWLRLDPEKDLDGYSDPLQITDKAYNDSCIWTDFTRDQRPRNYRLGVFGNLTAWNPSDIPPDKNPSFEKRLVILKQTPFSSERWTHVVVMWSGLGSKAGSAKLYVDGSIVGTTENIPEGFTWQYDKAQIRLGVNYAGLLDELAVFDRPLSESEIQHLHAGKDLLTGK